MSVTSFGTWAAVPRTFTHTAEAPAPASFSNSSISVSGDKIAMIGQVVWEDGGTHNIAKVGLRTGSGHNFVGTWQVSLQNVSTATAPARPDGVADQSVSDTTVLSANTWVEFTLGSVRNSVASGSLLAVVSEITALTSGSFQTSYLPTTSDSGASDGVAGVTIFASATWTMAAGRLAMVSFVSDDVVPVYGSFVSMDNASALNSHAYNNTSNPKAHGMSIVAPTSFRCIGAKLPWALAGNTTDFVVELLNNAGVQIAVATFDATTLAATVGNYTSFLWDGGAVTLTSGAQYYLFARPTTGNNITVYSRDFNAAGDKRVHHGGDNFHYVTLSSGDVISAPTNTRLLLASLLVDGIETSGFGGATTVNMKMGISI